MRVLLPPFQTLGHRVKEAQLFHVVKNDIVRTMYPSNGAISYRFRAFVDH
jgi:hypothetical protein